MLKASPQKLPWQCLNVHVHGPPVLDKKQPAWLLPISVRDQRSRIDDWIASPRHSIEVQRYSTGKVYDNRGNIADRVSLSVCVSRTPRFKRGGTILSTSKPFLSTGLLGTANSHAVSWAFAG